MWARDAGEIASIRSQYVAYHELKGLRGTMPRDESFEALEGFIDKLIRVTAFDSSRGWESPRMSFIVNRPAAEPGFGLERAEGDGRRMHYTVRSYAADRPEGSRYG